MVRDRDDRALRAERERDPRRRAGGDRPRRARSAAVRARASRSRAGSAAGRAARPAATGCGAPSAAPRSCAAAARSAPTATWKSCWRSCTDRFCETIVPRPASRASARLHVLRGNAQLEGRRAARAVVHRLRVAAERRGDARRRVVAAEASLTRTSSVASVCCRRVAAADRGTFAAGRASGARCRAPGADGARARSALKSAVAAPSSAARTSRASRARARPRRRAERRHDDEHEPAPRRPAAARAASTRVRSLSGARGACARSSVSDGASHSRSSPILSSSRFNARLSRVEHAVWLMPSTRAALGPSSSSSTRSATTSRSAGRELAQRLLERAGQAVAEVGAWHACPARTCPRAGVVAPRRGTSRWRRCARSGRARCAASRGAGRSGASVRNAFSNVSAARSSAADAVAGEVDEVAVDGVELLGHDVGEAGAHAERGGDRARSRHRVHALLYGARGGGSSHRPA